jgi:hypothetical protein
MVNLSRVVLLLVVFLGGCDVFDSKNKNSRLETLTVSSGTLNPAFSPDVTGYAVTVDAATNTITISAAAEKGKALVSINGAAGTKGNGSADVSLDVGSNSVSVVVSAEKRKKQTAYTINVTRLTPTYSIGGTVSGLTGDVTLQNNGADDLMISADGAFTFATVLDDGSDYDVTVATQPAGQECTVTNGSGTLDGADVSNVDVTCVDLSFTVGGLLSGLNDGNNITLQNNGADDLDLTADGSFTFVTEVDNGANYDVTISSQPADQECTVSNGSGTIDGANITNVVVDCGAILVKLVAGTVTGLVGTAKLQLNGGSDLLVVKNGLFNFTDQFTGGEAYAVTVLTQPVNQNCTVSNGSGTIGSGHVLDVLVECTGAGVSTGSIFDWEWVEPLPQGNPIRDLVSDGTQVVGVGGYGHIQTSPDGANWTTRDSGISTSLDAVAHGNGVFVALGSSDGVILTSSDGATWAKNYLGFNQFRGITWSGSQFVAVGFGWTTSSAAGALAATSPDGLTWALHPIALQTPQLLWDVAWNGSLFAAVSVSSNEIVTSPDGVSWTSVTIGDAATRLRNIESDGSRFVAIGSGGQVFTSPDGAAWTQEANPFPMNSAADLYWDGSRFVAASGDQFITSVDGSDWVSQTAGTATSPASVANHGGLNIIGTHLGAVYTSPNDTTWTTTFVEDSNDMYEVTWDGSQFVAAGTRQTIRTSPDGITWTTRNTGGSSSLFSVVLGGGQYVASGFGSTVLTSPDAITWTPQSLPAGTQGMEDASWGDNQFVGINWGRMSVLTSPDGETWTEQTSGLEGADFLEDVAWNGTIWVATGYQVNTEGFGRGFVWTSPDAIQWTAQEISELPDWSWLGSIESNGSVFVATDYQHIATSTDGLNWSFLQTNAFASEVRWTGAEFMVGSYATGILSSSDGLTWSVTRSITNANVAASSGDTTVIIGGNSGWGMATKRPPP